MVDIKRPNIMLIMSDQHNPSILGSAGDAVVKTPNLDKLAEKGLSFDNAYCSSPLCVPSRMSFMTSQPCSKIRVWSNRCFLSSHIPTFVHSLGIAGYETVISGRMHFNGPDQRHGFQKRIYGSLYGSAYGSQKWQSGPIPAKTLHSKRIALEVAGPGNTSFLEYDQGVADASCEYIRQYDSEKPFFLTAGFFLPHPPYICPEQDYEYYKDKVSLPSVPPKDYFENLPLVMKDYTKKAHGFDPDSFTEEELLHIRRSYYGMVTYMDRMCGQIFNALANSRHADNTIIIYLSDHGEMLGERKLWWKWCFFENSVRVPMIISWPDQIVRNTRIPEIVSLMDIGPTLIDIAGGQQLPHGTGKSLSSILFDTHQRTLWQNEAIAEINEKGDIPPGKMVRKDQWKLVKYHGYDPILYDLKNDPEETRDVSKVPANKELVKQLLKRLMRGWDPEMILEIRKRNGQDLDVISRFSNIVHPEEPDRWCDSDEYNVYPLD